MDGENVICEKLYHNALPRIFIEIKYSCSENVHSNIVWSEGRVRKYVTGKNVQNEDKATVPIFFFPDCANYTAMPPSKLVCLVQN